MSNLPNGPMQNHSHASVEMDSLRIRSEHFLGGGGLMCMPLMCQINPVDIKQRFNGTEGQQPSLDSN